MRQKVDLERLRAFMVEFARSVRGPGRVYFTGGATAIGHGFRHATNDIDLSFDPEPYRTGDALRELKERLDINVEPSRPSDFIPELPGWESRSLFIDRLGEVASSTTTPTHRRSPRSNEDTNKISRTRAR